MRTSNTTDTHDLSRGGFQNRDVGRTLFDRDDYGPDYGIDFAQFSAPNDLSADMQLKKNVCGELEEKFPGFCMDLDLYVRNGFVFLKGAVEDEKTKLMAEEITASVDGVVNVINVLSIRY